MVGPHVENLGNRVCAVVFPTPEDVMPDKAEALIPPLEALAPAAILIEVPPLRGIDPSMVAFIISMMSSGKITASVIGVVAKSAVVRVTLRAIQAALKVYGKDLEIATHDTRELAVAWANERVAALPSK